MTKKSLIAAVLASLTFATALPATFLSSPAQPTYASSAKAAAGSTVARAVKKTGDLNPSSSVQHFSKATYTKYSAYFDKQYNVDRMNKSSVFTKHRATVYTPSSQLRGYLAASMKTWNKSLGATVFATGTKAHHTITVNFGTGGKDASEWDGLYKTNKLYVNKRHFYSPSYMLTVLQAISGHKVSAPKTAADKAAYEKYYMGFWEATITHELGHSLGLDHTPYQDDIMYAQSGDSSSSIKYSWTTSKAGNGTVAALTNVLSTRDVNRAKLTKLLGYW